MASPRPRAMSNTDKATSKAPDQLETPQHIDDLSVQWDQTYLRLNYILGSLGGPVAGAEHHSSPSSTSVKTGAGPAVAVAEVATTKMTTAPSYNDIELNTSYTGRTKPPSSPAAAAAAASASAPKSTVPNFPGLNRVEAARKVAQIDTWRHEVASHADATLCGCSLGAAIPYDAAEDDGLCYTVIQGLLPAAVLAGTLATPVVVGCSLKKSPVVFARGADCDGDDGSSTSTSPSTSSGSSSSGGGSSSNVSRNSNDTVCDLCGRPRDVGDLVGVAWPGDSGTTLRVVRRIQQGLLRIGRRKQYALPTSNDADHHNPGTVAAASTSKGPKPTVTATTTMYHMMTDPVDQNPDLDDSTSNSTIGQARHKLQPKLSKGGDIKALTVRQQAERGQRLKDARLRRAQELLEKGLGAEAPKTTTSAVAAVVE